MEGFGEVAELREVAAFRDVGKVHEPAELHKVAALRDVGKAAEVGPPSKSPEKP